jgi:hypothetical protein
MLEGDEQKRRLYTVDAAVDFTYPALAHGRVSLFDNPLYTALRIADDAAVTIGI